MEWIELQVIALSNSESAPGHYVLVLEEAASRKRLPIIIGAFEAQAIALYMERLQAPRPLTHDLFAHTLQQLQMRLAGVYIYDVLQGAFAAHMQWIDKEGRLTQIDARTSDAIAIALRMQAGIHIASHIFDQFALSEVQRQGMLRGSLLQYSLEELEMLLSDLLEKEDYESAARVRDIIAKKKQQP